MYTLTYTDIFLIDIVAVFVARNKMRSITEDSRTIILPIAQRSREELHNFTPIKNNSSKSEHEARFFLS